MNSMRNWLQDFMESPRWSYFVFVFLISILILFLRRPDILLYPQFWAEDGLLWYADVMNGAGLASLFVPVAGYFQTISRLSGLVTSLLSPELGPLVFNLIGLTFRALPIVFLFSSRFSLVVPRFDLRVALAALYLLMPDSGEVLANVTNTHTYLALLCFMVLVAPAPKGWTQKAFDYSVYTLSCLSGAFIILLYPIILLLIWKRGVKESLKRYAYPLLLGLVQPMSMLFAEGRSVAELGASVPLFVEIVVKRVILGLLFGAEWAGELYARAVTDSWAHFLFVVLIVIGAGVVLIEGLRKLSFEGRLFILFAGFTFVAALASPMASFTEVQWPLLALAGGGMRYWFFSMMGFGVLILASFASEWRIPRMVARAFGVLIVVAMISSFRFDPWPDLNYQEKIQEYIEGDSGVYAIPIMPEGWVMELRK